MARADDEVVAAEIDALDRRWKERQQAPVVARGERQALQPRRVNAMTLDPAGYRSGHVEQREDVGVGTDLAQRFEDPLSAAHAGEPVMDERNAH